MAYQKQQFKNYAVLTAEQLNHIEDGIVAAENNANSRVKTVNGRNPDINGNVNLPTSDGTVKTVNGVSPDESGNVEIAIPDSGGNVDQAQIEQAVADYLEKNPVTGGAPGADGSDANVTAENIQTALGYTPADAEDVTQLQSDVERILTKDEKNLFSFDDADENLSILSKNSSSTNYINQTSSDYGYKDTDNGYFVCNGGGYNYAITGGMALRPPSGSYKLSAEIYIPSGNTNRTMVAFGVCAFPPNSSGEFKQKTNFDLGTQDTWVNVECVIAVTDDHTAVYISMHSYIDTYPFYMRNIKLISLEPEQTGWGGKKWVAIGDSITEKNSTSLKNYHDYIAESTGINVVNMGVSGTGYKTKFDTSGAFYQRISNVPTDADVVTIFGGGNDLADIWDTYGLGKATDTGTDTICGCINTAIDNLYAVLPTVQLGIITPTPWGAYNTHNNSASGNRMTLLVEKIIEICEYRGIPCLDLYHCSGLRPWDSAFCELAFSAQASIHPNEVGHSIIAPRIYNFLESLVPLG